MRKKIVANDDGSSLVALQQHVQQGGDTKGEANTEVKQQQLRSSQHDKPLHGLTVSLLTVLQVNLTRQLLTSDKDTHYVGLDANQVPVQGQMVKEYIEKKH